MCINDSIVKFMYDTSCKKIKKYQHTCIDAVHHVVTQQQNTVKRDTTMFVHRAHYTVHGYGRPVTTDQELRSVLLLKLCYSEWKIANSKIINNCK